MDRGNAVFYGDVDEGPEHVIVGLIDEDERGAIDGERTLGGVHEAERGRELIEDRGARLGIARVGCALEAFARGRREQLRSDPGVAIRPGHHRAEVHGRSGAAGDLGADRIADRTAMHELLKIEKVVDAEGGIGAPSARVERGCEHAHAPVAAAHSKPEHRLLLGDVGCVRHRQDEQQRRIGFGRWQLARESHLGSRAARVGEQAPSECRALDRGGEVGDRSRHRRPAHGFPQGAHHCQLVRMR